MTTNVVYVSKKNAKTLKTLLEEASLLDKRFRMTKAATNEDEALRDCIAVPITEVCSSIMMNERSQQPAWISLVEGRGRQPVPFSTGTFAGNKVKNVGAR
jgi:hypothetical protein